MNVSKLKLRYLFTSDNLENPVNEGKILAYVVGSLNEKRYSIFAIRNKPLSQLKFFAVQVGRHTKLFRDVMLKDWNFILDKNKLFYVKNETEVERNVPFDDAKKIFDILGNMSPLVHKAILANYEHRMRLRERKLIKLPEDEMR